MDHLYGPKVATHDVVTSSDNLTLECLYQGHSFYDVSKSICLALHLTFLKYCPTRSRVSGSTLRLAISIFFDFAEEYNRRHPVEMWLTKITDLTAEVFKQFENYLLKTGKRLENASRLKTALKSAATLTDAIPDLLLPFAKRSNSQARMPFSDETADQLRIALTTSADRLYEKLQFRLKVDQSEAYNLDDLISKATAETEVTLETIFQWLHYLSENDKNVPWEELRSKLASSKCPELNALVQRSDWRRVLYASFLERGEEHSSENPVNPFRDRRAYKFELDPARMLKTIIEMGYPFNMDLEEIGEKYAIKNLHSLEKCHDPIQLFLYILRKPFTPLGMEKPVQWDELLGMYYPTMQDMSCLVQFIMLQTNWNKEAVLALDPDNFEHALTGAMNEDHVMLQTEKNRSQGHDKPYYAPKEIVAVSTTSDIYSARNLFKLAIRLSEPLQQYQFDYVRHGMQSTDYSPAFLCMRFYADWVKKGGRHTSASNEKAFQQGTKQFLKEFPIYDDGERLESGKDLTWRLRPTWVRQRKGISGASHGLLALFLGHASTTTTDVHYDNSPVAQQERYNKLESELEEILKLMHSGKFEGMLGAPAQHTATQLPFKIFHIPGMVKALWACANQQKPSWLGASQRVAPGQRCYVISKCTSCSQCIIFEDSLPYLIERRIHVVELIEDQPDAASEYSNDWETELSKINSILDRWDDEAAIKEATRYQRRNSPLLPRDLNFLQVILEEEDRK